jgi:hypothetical protein
MEEDSTANALQTETWREDGLTSHPETASEGRRGVPPFKRLPENRPREKEDPECRFTSCLYIHVLLNLNP